MPAAFPPALERRYDLDWLRICAIALLIVTHSNYVFVSWHWRVHSPNGGMFGDLIYSFLAPWRMALVFFIGGAATRFMLDKLDFRNFVQNRFFRLIVPFVFAFLVLLPPINYIAFAQAREQGYWHYLTHDFLDVKQAYGLWLPEFIHAWFLLYVFCYAIVAGLAWRFARSRFKQVERLAESTPIGLILFGMAAIFYASDTVLARLFDQSGILIDDPAGHVRSVGPFVLGLLVVRSTGFWIALRRSRAWLYGLAAILLAIVLAAVIWEDIAVKTQISQLSFEIAHSLYGAVMLLAILAFASTTLNRKTSSQAYFSDAIMPIYLLHNLILVIVAKLVLLAHLPLWIEYPLVIGLVATACLLIYHITIRPFDPIRFVFGMKLKSEKKIPQAALSAHEHVAN